jgi:peptide/nickel transport system permease protein
MAATDVNKRGMPTNLGIQSEPSSRSLGNIRRKRPGLLGRLIRDKIILGAFLFLLAISICAISPGTFAPHDPAQQSLRGRLQPPLTETARGRHLLGTDALGRDVFSRVVYGARVSMLVAIASVIVAGLIGVAIGLIGGYWGGLVDDLLGWITNVQLSFPFLLLAIAVVAVLGPGLRNVIIVLGLTTWVVYSRLARGQVLAVKSAEYIEAARVLGLSTPRIIVRHILPNITTPLIVISTFQLAQNIIAEASLSFLGLGAGTDSFSWGSLMADGRSQLATSWWIATMPGIAIMLTILTVNLLGDWLRDELDPRQVRS